MKKILLTGAICILASIAAQAQEPLKFNSDGTFKIVQFTDLHYKAEKAESRIVLKRIDEVLEAEKPDLVVVTGDIIYSLPAKKNLKAVMNCISSHKVPFCTVFGNHDADFGTDKSVMYDYIRSFKGCVMPDRKGVLSPDYPVAVMSRDGEKAAAILYMIDSNSHIFDENGKFVSYDYIQEHQIEWYRTVSKYITKENGGEPLPSLAFFHIPIPEFHDAVASEGCTMIGTRMESICSPVYNSGLFRSFKEMGDVFGVFVGHDHDNDYAVCWQNILLAYGRFTGGNTEYNNLPNGARVIILKEGKKELDSYIRLKGGKIINEFSFPKNFHKTDWRSRPLDPECR